MMVKIIAPTTARKEIMTVASIRSARLSMKLKASAQTLKSFGDKYLQQYSKK
jgi:hypothetical protein